MPQFQRAAGLGGRFDSGPIQIFAWALLCSYVFVLVVSIVSSSLTGFVECLPLVTAELFGRGRLPGIDFQSIYPPGSDYLLSTAFHWFGKTVLAQRAIHTILLAAVIAAVTQLFRRRAERLRPLAPLMTLIVAMGIGTFGCLFPNWLGSGAALLALTVYASEPCSGENYSRRRLAIVGALAGAASLLRFNFSLYVACVVAADLVATEWRAGGGRPKGFRPRRVAADLCVFGGPLLAVAAAGWVALYGAKSISAFGVILPAARAAIEPRFMDIPFSPGWIVIWPCVWTCLREVFRSGRLSGKVLLALLPAPILLGALAAGRSHPAAALWLTALGVANVVFLHAVIGGFDRAEFCFLLYFAVVLHYYLTSADGYHAAPFHPILSMTLPLLFSPRSAAQATSDGRYGRWTVLLILAAMIAPEVRGPGATMQPKAEAFLAGLRSLRSAAARISDADRLAARAANTPWILDVFDPKAAIYQGDESKAIAFLRNSTGPDEPIFVGVRDHSRVGTNDLRIYWLADRMPGSRYVQLDAGVASREETQRRIVSDLNRNRVRWAVLEDTSAGSDNLEILERLGPGSLLLDEFLARNYRSVATFGPFTVCERATIF